MNLRDPKRLVILSTLKAVFSDGHVTLTRKFVEGVSEYSRLWDGPVVVLLEQDERSDANLDQVKLPLGDLSFQVRPVQFHQERALGQLLDGAAVTLAALDSWQRRAGAVSASVGTPCVYVSECTLATRKQIVRAQTRNPILRLRRTIWHNRLERSFETAVRGAAGIQCNGTPTYEAYRNLSRRPLLFFDTRVTRQMIVKEQVLQERIRELLSGGPLRLAFSGRWVAIKGTDHLPAVARILRHQGVKFTMDLYGGGDQEPLLRRQIARHGLEDCMRLRGVLDFAGELMPAIARSADLFVCCHRQGDPSCTYMETLSCGTPIIGYDNEAWRGLSRLGDVGWVTPLDDPQAMAAKIGELERNRRLLVQSAHAAAALAARHVFEEVMRMRVEHLRVCAQAVRASDAVPAGRPLPE